MIHFVHHQRKAHSLKRIGFRHLALNPYRLSLVPAAAKGAAR